jgi:uncharacterized protein YndB with AHSA1/START domain
MMIRRLRTPTRTFTFLLVFAAGDALCEVKDSAANGFTSVHDVVIAASAARVFAALTTETSKWWDPAHTHSGDAGNLSMQLKAGGCFCERLPDGGVVEHLRVVLVRPGGLLRLSGGLGPLQNMGNTGSMEFRLEPQEDGGTLLRYRYVVGGYYGRGLDTIAETVDQVQLGQLMRLKRYVEEGAP